MLLLDRFLFNAASWVSNSGPNINDPASPVFVATPMGNNSMQVENGLDEPFGGALVSNTGPLYTVNGNLLPYVAWHFEFRFVPETYANLARFENDNKTCIKTRPNSATSIRNVCNWSTQWNRDTGSFQVDKDPPKWVDSGYYPSAHVTTPDDWHSLDFRYSYAFPPDILTNPNYDQSKVTFQINTIQWDDELYTMPSEFQGIPMSLTNWEACRKLQLQTEGYYPGTVLVQYRNGVLGWSDAPIPAQIPTQESYT